MLNTEMNLGEKIETIILSRTDGKYGKYLGATAQTFGACEVDGKIYKVERNIEVDSDKPFWTVRNITDNTVATEDDQYYLGCIKPEHFH